MAEIYAFTSSFDDLSIPVTGKKITPAHTQKLPKKCYELKIIDPKKQLKEIEQFAFDNIHIGSFSIEDGLQIIGDGAFYNCQIDSKTVIIPDSVTHIGANAFSGNNFVRLALGNCSQTVGASAFSDCKNLAYLILPDGVTEVPDKMCQNCSSLRVVRLGEQTKTLGESAFEHSGLPEIELPESLQTVGARAFAETDNLYFVSFYGGTQFSESAFYSSSFSNEPELYLIFDNENRFGITSNSADFITTKPSTKLTGIYSAFNDQAINLHHLEKHISGIFAPAQEKKEHAKGHKNLNFIKALNNAQLITSPEFIRLYQTLIKERIVLPFEFVRELHEAGKLKEFIEHSKLTRFKRIVDSVQKTYPKWNATTSDSFLGLTKLAYALGVFSSDNSVSQQSAEFLATLIEPAKGKNPRLAISAFSCANDLSVEVGYHPAFSALMRDTRNSPSEKKTSRFNLERLIEEDLLYPGLFADAYHRFNDINRGNVQNHGLDRKNLILPFDALLMHLTDNFGDALENTNSTVSHQTQIELAKHLSSTWLLNQTNVKRCLNILEEFDALEKSGELTPHLTREKLQSASAVASVAKARAMAQNEAKRFLRDFIQTATETATKPNRDKTSPPTPAHIPQDGEKNPFKFEFIAKNDVRNFGSSKPLKSCAFVDGSGFRIMLTSVLDPDCQNVLITDPAGNTIGKYILMLDRKKGTALINALYLEPDSSKALQSGQRVDLDKLEDQIAKDMNASLDCFLESVHTFILAYNAEANDHNSTLSASETNKHIAPIEQVNMGLCKPTAYLTQRGYQSVNARSNLFLMGKEFEKMERDYEPFFNPNLTLGDWQVQQTVIYLSERKKHKLSSQSGLSDTTSGTSSSQTEA